MLGLLARYARPILLLDASLLLGGVLLTSMNLLLIGWSVYVCGHVLAIVAFLALGAVHRDQMDGWSWAGLLVLEAGLILALPQIASIWSSYAQTPTGAVMLLPAESLPLGRVAEAVMWVGLGFYGLAARARALPAGVGWLFVAAAVIGLLAEFVDVWFITPFWWAPAMLVMTFGLVAAGASVAPVARRTLGDVTA